MASEPAVTRSRPPAAASASTESYRWVAQQCPICEVLPQRRLGRRGGAAHRAGAGVECEIWRCGSCGLVFPHPMPVPAGGLAQHYHGADDYFRAHTPDAKMRTAAALLEQAAELTPELTRAPRRLLDVGAGRGELLRAARERGWSAIGLEPSPAFAELAAAHSGAEVRCETLERAGHPDAAFDVVVLAGVLEHGYDPDGTVREVARVLRRGGVLFVDVPNEAGIYFRLGNLYHRLCGRDWVVNLAPTFPPFHTFGFGGRSLRRLLGKHGLRPVRWRTYGGRALVPRGAGVRGALEQRGAQLVTLLGRIGPLGTYIETWAVKAA